MARYRGPRCKLSRREGYDLLLTSPIRKLSEKCKDKKKPGIHGESRKKISDYGVQLREKQRIRRMYAILEKQFRGYYEKAKKAKGNSGLNLLLLLERRLDNLVFRSGFAVTRAEARQLVSHKGVLVNGKLVNIPSYLVRIGDIISLGEKAKEQTRVQSAISIAMQLDSPDWLSVNHKDCTSSFLRLPEREELDPGLSENTVIELYSK